MLYCVALLPLLAYPFFLYLPDQSCIVLCCHVLPYLALYGYCLFSCSVLFCPGLGACLFVCPCVLLYYMSLSCPWPDFALCIYVMPGGMVCIVFIVWPAYVVCLACLVGILPWLSCFTFVCIVRIVCFGCFDCPISLD